MKKKMLSMLLIVLMVLSLVPVSAVAAGTDDDPYDIGDVVTGDTEPTGAKAADSYWVRTDHEAVYDTEPTACTNTDTEHQHSVDAGCYPVVTAAYTSWTLTAIPKYTVTITAYGPSNRGGTTTLNNVTVMIDDANGSTIAYLTTNRSGVATIDLPAGSYKAIVSYTSGRNAYKGETTFTVSTTPEAVTVTAAQISSSDYDSYAEYVYDVTTYFDHVDIRVRGTYTTGYENALQQYDITLRNAKVTITDGGTVTYTADFSDQDDETYEWRKTGIQVSKSAVISLVVDIYQGDTLLKSGYTTTFSGKADFLQAIEDCNNQSGLDFYVNPYDVLEAIYYEVNYEWEFFIEDASGARTKVDAPAHFSPLPETDADILPNGSHTIDTTYTYGEWLVVGDYVYHFDGWTKYYPKNDKDPATVVSPTAPGSITAINEDMTVYGSWVRITLPTASAHFTLVKQFESDLRPDALYFRVTDVYDAIVDYDLITDVFAVNGNTYTVEIPIYVQGDSQPSDWNITITEYGEEIDGYTCTTTSTVASAGVEGAVFSKVSGGGDTITFTAEPPVVNAASFLSGAAPASVDFGVNIGTVTFTNTYEKKTGAPVSVYPGLSILKLADDNAETNLSGAVFTLTNGEGNSVDSEKTNSSGYTTFTGLEPGTYTLVEKTAPTGYYKDDRVFTVVVSKSREAEELRDGEYVTVTYYDIEDVIVDGDSSIHFNGTINRLIVYNSNNLGSLTISKDIAGDLSRETVGDKEFNVTITGPDSYSNTVTLDADNNWTVTVDNLAAGTYSVSEIISNAAIAGYEHEASYAVDSAAAASVQVTLSETKTSASITVTNTYTKIDGGEEHRLPDLTIIKQDEDTNAALGGAVFTLTPASGTAIVSPATDSATGKTTFTDIPAGTYTLTETTAPTGYVLDSTLEYTVTVSLRSGYPKEELIGGKWVDVYEYDVAVTPDADLGSDGLVITNTPVTGSLTLSKEFGADSALDKNSFPATGSIVVRVTGANNYSKDVTLSASNNWTTTITGMPIGTYSVEELVEYAGITGYSLKAAYSAQSVTFTYENIAAAVTVTNTYTQNVGEDVHEPAGFKVQKVDENGEPLAGAVFTLYDSNGAVVMELTTDATGAASFGGFKAKGSYTLKETKAPEGYKPIDTVWVIEIGLVDETPALTLDEDKNLFQKIFSWSIGGSSPLVDGVLTVANEPYEKINVSVEKKWVCGDDAAIPGSVTVALYKDGVVYENKVLSAANNWSYTWTGLSSEFEWTVDEIAVPSGFYRVIKQSGNHFKITNYDNDIPNTGDSARIWLWAGLAVLAVGGIGYVVWDSKRKKHQGG